MYRPTYMRCQLYTSDDIDALFAGYGHVDTGDRHGQTQWNPGGIQIQMR